MNEEVKERHREAAWNVAFAFPNPRGRRGVQQDVIRTLSREHATTRRETIEECAAKVRADCSACDNGVYDKIVHEILGGEDGCTPVDYREEAVECEYCGRPMAAILALLASEEKTDE